MKLKKIFTVILMVMVALSLSAGYLLMGFSPKQAPPQATPVTIEQTATPPAYSDFQAPTSQPSVKGPASPPPGN